MHLLDNTVHNYDRTLTFEVPVRPWSLNGERSKHWATNRQRIDDARDAAYIIGSQMINKARLTRPVYERVGITVYPWALNHRYRQDIGNCYPTVKACIDGLVLSGLLEDDNDEHLRALTFRPHQYGRDALVLVVRGM